MAEGDGGDGEKEFWTRVGNGGGRGIRVRVRAIGSLLVFWSFILDEW